MLRVLDYEQATMAVMTVDGVEVNYVIPARGYPGELYK
jgi:hypothetical protein